MAQSTSSSPETPCSGLYYYYLFGMSQYNISQINQFSSSTPIRRMILPLFHRRRRSCCHLPHKTTPVVVPSRAHGQWLEMDAKKLNYRSKPHRPCYIQLFCIPIRQIHPPSRSQIRTAPSITGDVIRFTYIHSSSKQPKRSCGKLITRLSGIDAIHTPHS